MVSELLTYLNNNEQQILKTIEEAVNIESPTNDKPGCDTIIEYFATTLNEMGLETQILKRNKGGNHLKAVWHKESKEGQILVLSHLDTVWPVGTTAERSFKIEGDKAFGPGVFDMKTGAVQTVYALKGLLELDRPINKRIVLLYNTDEETGSGSSRAEIEAEAKKSDIVFVLEPSVPPKGALKTFRKGVGIYNLTIEGKSSHAGADPEKGISAILELGHQIVHLTSLADHDQGTTVNVGVVSGGTRRNVVAATAKAMIDVRVTSLDEGERIDNDMKAIRQFVPGTNVKITGGINRPPMIRTEQTVKYFKKAQALATELGFDVDEASTGGGSDGNFTAALGVPTIDGLGAVGAGGHAVDEHIYISHIVPRTALLARLLETL